MATVQDILAHKGREVRTISASLTVLEATRLMNEHKIGAMVVMDENAHSPEHMVGMFTERDVLSRVVAIGIAPERTTVSEVMTTNVVICTPDTSIEEIGRLMKDFRVRHIPVIGSHDELLGLVSIGDVNAYHVRDQEVLIHTLETYIHGRV